MFILDDFCYNICYAEIEILNENSKYIIAPKFYSNGHMQSHHVSKLRQPSLELSTTVKYNQL